MAKKTIEDINLKGKKVLIRCDFNVPLDEYQQITDDRRIQASLPTIKKALQEGASIILCSHLGRPKGEFKPELSLAPVSLQLTELLGQEVALTVDCIGDNVQNIKSELQPGQVLLLENLRFHNEETKNEPNFAKQLAQGCNVFINDAFGTAHRAHASTEGVTHFFNECVAGYLIEKELNYLGKALDIPEHPFIAILGGAKISGKIDVIKNLFDKVDILIIGGGMIFTFFKAQGYEIGKSLLEKDRVLMASELFEEAKQKNVNLLLPEDVIIADDFNNDAQTKMVNVNEIPADWMGLDIGPKTIEKFSTEIAKAKTIVWNGPMGAFEMEKFSVGTKRIANC
jgi:phosphoglycerate kinase